MEIFAKIEPVKNIIGSINMVPSGGGAGGQYNIVSTDNGDGTQSLAITDAQGAPVIQPLSVTENGTYTAPEGVEGYNPVVVALPESETPYADSVKGLLKYWFDGIKNAGLDSEHSANITTWKNLAGGADGAITNGIWGSNHLKFNGLSTWVNCGEYNPATITVEAVVKFNVIGVSGNESNAVVGNWQSGGWGISQGSYNNNAADINVWTNTSATVSSSHEWKYLNGSIVDIAYPHVLSISFDGNNLRMYEDGIQVDAISANGIIFPPTNSTVMSIGSNPNGSAMGIYPLDGNVYSIRIWDAGFDSDVIAGLASESMERFGLI